MKSINDSSVPISSLNPFHNNWQIKAKVIAKRPIHFWKNEKGTGKLFNMDLYDESAQIRVTVFNDLVDKFFDKIECGKVYLISDANLKDANKKYSTIKNNFEIIFTNDTEMIEIDEKSGNFLKLKIDFHMK